MNTRILYLYRDAAGLKTHKSAVVRGRLSYDQIEGFLIWSNRFIPQLVGLPGAQRDHWRINNRSPNDDDHVYHEIASDGLEPTLMEADWPLSADKLLANFRAAFKDDWPVHDTMKELGLLL